MVECGSGSIEDDWEVSIHYLPSPTQVETGLRLVNIDACFDANRSSSLDLKEICTKGGGIFTDVAWEGHVKSLCVVREPVKNVLADFVR